jgi:predicted ATPase
VELRDGMAREVGRRHAGNLPESLASFVGRERELLELKRLLARNRILTLVGPGGIGKTRLSLQLAAEVADAFRDGEWFIDLAPLADPDLVESAAARALNVQQMAGSLIDGLCRHLKGRQALLLVDNCEHVVDASARMVEAILKRSPGPAIVATSREPLRVEGEQVYWLQPLPLPDARAHWDEIRKADAVALFVDRAQHQEPAFALSEAIADDVARLCVRLDGIPLALELAAPLVHSYSIDEINARLAHRFDALTVGRRTALPHQQTLRATLDWSYDVLSDGERKVLQRLSVFSGGFTVEAAAAVVGDAIPGTTVADVLARLVARSLVVGDAADSGRRCRLLETMRAYARERMDATGETASVQRRHAEYFREFFETALADWFRMPDIDWHAIYLPELDNVRYALHWTLRAGGDAAIGISLAASSRSMWTALGLHSEGRQWLEVALSRVDSRTSQSDRARLQLSLGVLLQPLAPNESLVNLERAVDMYRKLGDRITLGFALAFIARPLAELGHVEHSSLSLAEAAPLVEHSGLPKLRGFFFGVSGWLKTLTGDMVGARLDVERALALYVESGAEYAAPATLLGDLTWAMGDLNAAISAFGEVVALMRRSTISRKPALGWALANLAGVLTERGELDQAMAAAREGLPLLAEVGGLAWKFMDHFALCAALARRFSSAARLAGFADAAFASRERARERNEARARERLQRLLPEALPTTELRRLLADGAKLTEEEACRLALED